MKEMYFYANGLAYSKGIDNFESVVPFARFKKLYNSTNNFRLREFDRFIKRIIQIAIDESIRPKCTQNCQYRLKYDNLPLQRNAFRIEIMSPADRCGWNLKSNRIGGRPDDYHPCTFAAHT